MNSTALQAGTQTGSLINHLMSGSKLITPEIGMGCTMLGWTDRHAATIVEVKRDGKLIGIKQDIATRTDDNGMSDSQSYEFTPNPEAGVQWYSFRPKVNAFVRVGDSVRGARLLVGHREEYYDYSF